MLKNKLNESLLRSAFLNVKSSVESDLKKGADINCIDENGFTPLMLAVRHMKVEEIEKKRCIEVMKCLIERGADIHHTNDKGETALKIALNNNNYGAISLLISNGADINYTYVNGYTALSLLCISCESKEVFELIKNLVKKGARTDIVDYKGDSLLHCAVRSYRSAVLHNQPNLPISLLEYFITFGLNIELQNNDGDTPLLLAAAQGAHILVEYLISKKANIHHQNKAGNTALSLASELLKTPQNLIFGSDDKVFKEKQAKTILVLDEATKKQQQQEIVNNSFSQLSLSVDISSKDLVIDWNKKLGEGSYGVVYYGKYDNHEAAVKVLKNTKPSKEALEELQLEIKIMVGLKSPNIIQFYGYTSQSPYSIVMEYMNKGSLYQVLHSELPLNWTQRHGIILDVAYGLLYLHQFKPKAILHRDLKSLNVLLNNQLQAKLGDFGLAKFKTESRTTTTKSQGEVGTLAWMAPELVNKVSYTEKADMYSFGMVVWEVASRELPYKDIANQYLIPILAAQGKQDEIPKDCPPKIASLIRRCWEIDPNKRPAAEEVVKGLKGSSTEEKFSGLYKS